MSASPSTLRGVLAPVLTPFEADFSPSVPRFVRHCRALVAQGVGLAVFGTNSEGNSLSVAEKRTLLDALVDADLPPSRMMPGTGTCALPDTIELTRHAVRAGCAGVLMLPPFYYKGVSDEGLYRSFAAVIDAVADPRLRVYLYHIPPVAQVGISLDAHRPAAHRLPGCGRRHQGQLRRLEQHAGGDRGIRRQGLRRLRRQRDLPAADAACRRRGLHLGHGQRQRRRDRRVRRDLARSRAPTTGRRRSTACALRSRSGR